MVLNRFKLSNFHLRSAMVTLISNRGIFKTNPTFHVQPPQKTPFHTAPLVATPMCHHKRWPPCIAHLEGPRAQATSPATDAKNHGLLVNAETLLRHKELF